MNKNIKEDLKKKKKQGYTLVEMVLVITILGILTSLGFVKFGEVQRNAKLKADYVAASSIATATNLAVQDGVIKVNSNGKTTISTEDLKTNKYLSTMPKPQSSDEVFTVEIENDNVLVKAGDNILYPKEDK